jgi:hypothetical protein
MSNHHETPSLSRMELLGHLAAAARLALLESPDCDGVSLTVNATPEGVGFECVNLCGDQPVSGWGQ